MSSKYDLVKVKVTLAEGNYYVLSRFQLSKQLSFCELPESASSSIALELKKMLVNNNILELTHKQYTDILFETMRIWGFGGYHSRLFRTMTTFYEERLPLLLFVVNSPKRIEEARLQDTSSSASVGNSDGSGHPHQDGSLARFTSAMSLSLSSRLATSSSVVHASAALHISRSIHEVLQEAGMVVATQPQPLPTSSPSTSSTATSSNSTAAATEVAHALEADVYKAIVEGRVLVIDGGTHLDMSQFGMLLGGMDKDSMEARRAWFDRLALQRQSWGTSEKKGRRNAVVLALCCCTDEECDAAVDGDNSSPNGFMSAPVLPSAVSTDQAVASSLENDATEEDAQPSVPVPPATTPQPLQHPLSSIYRIRVSSGEESCADSVHRTIVKHISAALDVDPTLAVEGSWSLNAHMLMTTPQ